MTHVCWMLRSAKGMAPHSTSAIHNLSPSLLLLFCFKKDPGISHLLVAIVVQREQMLGFVLINLAAKPPLAQPACGLVSNNKLSHCFYIVVSSSSVQQQQHSFCIDAARPAPAARCCLSWPRWRCWWRRRCRRIWGRRAAADNSNEASKPRLVRGTSWSPSWSALVGVGMPTGPAALSMRGEAQVAAQGGAGWRAGAAIIFPSI